MSDKEFWISFVIITIVNLSVAGIIGYIAWHFISRFW